MRRRSLGVVTAICALLVAQSVSEAGYVRGYTRRDGTYVRGYYRGGGGGSSSSGASSISSTTFSSCADARASGYSNMTVGSAGYSSSLDRDGDGVACESGSGGGSSTARAGISASGSATTASARPGAALSGAVYFRARDLQEMGGVISKLGGTTYVLSAFGHTVNVIPNSIVIINDGREMTMAAPPVVYQNSLYIPAQYLYKFSCDLKLADTVMVLAECPNYRMFSSNATAIW